MHFSMCSKNNVKGIKEIGRERGREGGREGGRKLTVTATTSTCRVTFWNTTSQP